jgi:hypothetical protein
MNEWCQTANALFLVQVPGSGRRFAHRTKRGPSHLVWLRVRQRDRYVNHNGWQGDVTAMLKPNTPARGVVGILHYE